MPNNTNNWLKRLDCSQPTIGGGEREYYINMFEGDDLVILQNEVNAFLHALAFNDLPSPHLVSIEHTIHGKFDAPDMNIPIHYITVTYYAVG